MTDNSVALRMLIEGCVWPGRFDGRDLPHALGALTDRLARLDVRYALAGRLALGRYCAPQMTDLIELRLGHDAVDAGITNDLTSVARAVVGEGSTVSLTVGTSRSFVEDRFIASANIERWLGADVRMASSEHLLWLAISGETSDANADAERLLHSGHLDWDIFDGIVDGGDLEFGARLASARARAERNARSTYSESVERRVAMRLRRGPEARVAGL